MMWQDVFNVILQKLKQVSKRFQEELEKFKDQSKEVFSKNLAFPR